MGMAASQVRFLSLQNRKNTIGLNLMTLSNRRMALSRDMNRVSTEYNNAMNQRVLKWSNDSGVTYQNLNYDLLMKPNDANSNLPFILTDAQGRVVLDDNKIEIDGLKSEYSYRDLATLISAYNGINDNNEVIYDYTTGTLAASKDTNKYASGTKALVGYEIPTNINGYNFTNSVRYDIMTKLGLMGEGDKNQFESITKELYGSNNAYNKGDYTSILQSFDTDRAKAKTSLGNDYSEIFGSIDTTDGNFKLTGGCAMGNLALAKAYQAEYQAYLNTEIPQDILVDTKRTIATSTASTSELDEKNVTNTEYKYDELSNTGISNRMLALLTQTGEVTKSGNNYQLAVSGILNHLGFYDNVGTSVKSSDIIKGSILNDNDNKGTFGGIWFGSDDAKKAITNWGQLYDYDGGLDGGKSYDVNDDGYIDGSDYIDNSNNKSTGTSILAGSEYDKRSWDNYNNATGLYNIIDSFADSMKTIDNINESGIEFAKEKTKELYKNEYDLYGVRHECGPSDKNDSRRAAAGAADSLFGFGYDTIGGHTDPVAFNMTNMINAFITFYEMYMAVNGDTSRISSTGKGDKIFVSEMSNVAAPYHSDYVDTMKSSGNVMSKVYNDFLNETGATITNNDSGSHASGDTVTITYTQTTKDEENKETTVKMKVTGTWGTSGFSSISKIEKLTSDSKNIETLEYSNDASGNQTLTQTDYNDSGVKTNTVVYKVNNDGTSSAEIKYVTAQKVNGQDVTTIQMQNGNVVSVNGNGNLDKFKKNERIYYIIKEGSTTGEADESYKYALVLGDEGAKKSVFAATITMKPVDKYSEQLAKLVADCEKRVNTLQNDLKIAYAQFESRGMDYFDALFKMISEKGWVYDSKVNDTSKKEDSANYLNAMLENNMYFITEVDTLDGTDFNYATKLVTNVSKIFQVYDTDAQNVALSKYEAEKADINTKEKQLDVRINKLEAEQDAIKTELESIRKVIDDNVSNTFKIFT